MPQEQHSLQRNERTWTTAPILQLSDYPFEEIQTGKVQGISLDESLARIRKIAGL